MLYSFELSIYNRNIRGIIPNNLALHENAGNVSGSCVVGVLPCRLFVMGKITQTFFMDVRELEIPYRK
jgi:hypothetical protein